MFGILNSPKNRGEKFDFTTMIPQIDLFSFVFWEKLKTPKRHFEIRELLQITFAFFGILPRTYPPFHVVNVAFF